MSLFGMQNRKLRAAHAWHFWCYFNTGMPVADKIIWSLGDITVDRKLPTGRSWFLHKIVCMSSGGREGGRGGGGGGRGRQTRDTSGCHQ